MTEGLPLEEPFRALLDALPDCAFFTLDLHGQVSRWSDGAERLLGYEADEIHGAAFDTFFLPAEVESGHPEQALELASRLRRFEDEGLRVRRDGSTFWAHVSIAAIRADDNVTGFAVMVRDLTERHRSESRLRDAIREEVGRVQAELVAARFKLLADASRAFADAAPKVEGALDAVAHRVAETVGEACVVALTDARGVLRPAAVAHPAPEGRRLLRSLVEQSYGHSTALPAQVLQSGVPLLFSRMCTDLRLASNPAVRAFCEKFGASSLVIVPLRARGRALGVLVATRGEEAEPYGMEEQALLQQLADLAAIALENARLYEEVGRAHAEAEAERARLHTILMRAPALISIRRGPEHRIELANPPLQQLYGHRPLMGLTHEEALPDVPGYKAMLDEVYRTGRTVVLEESPLKLDWRCDGHPCTRYFSSMLQPLRGADGQVEGVVTFSQDVTDQVHARKRVEAAVERASDQRHWLEALLDSTPMPLILVDPEIRRVTFANRAADALAGGRFPRPSSEAEFCEVFRCTDANGNSIPIDRMPWARAARGEEVRGFQMDWHMPNGQTKSLQANARLLPATHGHPATALISYEDITQVKQVQEALQQAIRVRDAFLSIAGHELKTPLTTLQLQIQSLGRIALQEGEISFEKAARKVEAANRQTERLSVLIGQLLDVSRINAGRLSLDRQPLDLAALVREVCARFEDEAERMCAPLRVHAHGRWVGRWDRERLDQVLTNLVSNAIKYGRGKPVEVTLEGDETHARLVVRDHGIGIAEADQARIFDRFERAVSDRHYGGLGLGLWIVREIVNALGGTIRVESTPGEGSLFTVELPVATPA